MVSLAAAWALGCQQPKNELPIQATRQMRIMKVLEGYGDREFREQIDLNQLQELALEDWEDQQADLLKQRGEIEAWAQKALTQWRQEQNPYGQQLKEHLEKNKAPILKNDSKRNPLTSPSDSDQAPAILPGNQQQP